jgi:hypothetical protein
VRESPVIVKLGTAEAKALYEAALLAEGTHPEGSARINYRNAMKKLQAARFPHQPRPPLRFPR